MSCEIIKLGLTACIYFYGEQRYSNDSARKYFRADFYQLFN